MSLSISIWPILISAILFMPFGAFYYSEKGMGKAWLDAIGKTVEDIKEEDTNMGILMGSTLLLSVLTVFLIGVLHASIGSTSLFDLYLLILIVYLIVFSIRFKNALFDGNMKLFKVNLIGTLGEMIIVAIVFSFFVGG